MQQSLIDRLNTTYNRNVETFSNGRKSERRLLPKDEQLVMRAISSLGPPDSQIIAGSKLTNSKIVERVRNLRVPQIINGEVIDVNILSLKLQNNQIAKRTSEEIEIYLQNTSGEQIITDIKEIVSLITHDQEIVQYFIDHPAKKSTEKKQNPISLDHVIESQLNKQDQEKYSRLDEYAEKAINTESKKFQYLNSVLNLPPDEFHAKLITFIKNYMITCLDKARLTQLQTGVAADVGGTQEMFFVLGGPGAGKSSTIQNLKNNQHAFHAEADEIKMQLARSFGVDVNFSDMHTLSGCILKNVLIPQCLDLKINFILEKIGDEPHKIEALAQDYKSRGYETNLSCIHVDTQECRIRNIMRAVNYMKEGKPPRMVNDSEVQNIGYNPLITYIMLTQTSGHLFASGECQINQNPAEIAPQVLVSLDHGPVGEFSREEYIARAQVYSSHIIESVFNKYLAKHTDFSMEEMQIITTFKESVKRGDLTLPQVEGNFLKHLCILRTFSKAAVRNAFNPQVIVSPNPSKPFDIGIDEEFQTQDRKGRMIHYSSNASRIKESIDLTTKKGSEAYLTALQEAKQLLEKAHTTTQGVEV